MVTMQCSKCKQKIDEDLLPLILELNKIGLYTKYCCSGHDGEFAYIMFEGSAVKGVEYGFQVEHCQGSGPKFVLRWQIPKYRRKIRVRCSDCDKKMKDVVDAKETE